MKIALGKRPVESVVRSQAGDSFPRDLGIQTDFIKKVSWRELEKQRAFVKKETDYIMRNLAGANSFQAKGKRMLGQTGGLSRPNHQLAKCGLVGRMDGFADTAGG